MLKPSTEPNMFKPTFQLDSRQLGIMAAAIKQEWFDILQKIMEEELRLMNVHMMNQGDDSQILQAHRWSRGASMFYSGVMDRLREITNIDTYNNSGVGTPDNPETLALPPEFE